MAVVSYKCPNCDAGLYFQPEKQLFHCDYCLSDFVRAQLEQSGDHAAADAPEMEDTAVYSCPSCGAEVVTQATTAATMCYFCHNPVVLAGRLKGNLLPDQVQPFLLSKEKAKETFLQWVKKKWYVPRGFFKPDMMDTITGIYYPYWIVDYDLNSKLTAKGTKLRTWRVGDLLYTETSTYRIERDADVHLEDITKNALSSADRQLIEGVLPFDAKELKPFSMTYLSGFFAEKRDLERAHLDETVTQEAAGYAKTLTEGTISGYTGLHTEDFRFAPEKQDWKYALLPVWILTCKTKKQTYHYAVNGQNGKVCGKLPVSGKKLAALFGLLFAAVYFALLAVTML